MYTEGGECRLGKGMINSGKLSKVITNFANCVLWMIRNKQAVRSWRNKERSLRGLLWPDVLNVPPSNTIDVRPYNSWLSECPLSILMLIQCPLNTDFPLNTII